jgi:hypothetical protein
VSGRLGLRLRTILAVVIVGGFAVAGCTTVPNASDPSIVRQVPNNDPGQQSCDPVRSGTLPATIVQNFLDASAGTDPDHACARSLLTGEQRSRWSDDTATVVDRPVVGLPVGGDTVKRVTVTGHEIGTIDAFGVYSPLLRGDGTGTGASPISQTFVLKKARGEWRIDSLQKGLLLSATQFEEQYRQLVVYFYDVSEDHLVPDPRYTQLLDPSAVASWLVAQLAAGPRGGLQTGLPNQTQANLVHVVFPDAGSTAPTQITVPGASRLDRANRNRLAAQLAATLGQEPQIIDMEVTDGVGGPAVVIPAVGEKVFTPGQLGRRYQITPPEGRLFYVNDGAVFQENGRRLSGKVGSGAYGLSSVALRQGAGGALQIAGTRISGKQQVLDIGTPDQMFATTVHGVLSRPAWAPDVNEVWVGDGSDLKRVSTSGAVHTVPVDAVGGRVTGTVMAVRLSPEGSRVAVVLRNPSGDAQVYIGAVVRGSAQVRVADLAPISPQGIAVRDVAWNDQLKLFAIGVDSRTGGWGLYEVQCDGSLWTLRSNSGLPQAPESLTVATQSLAAVATGGTVYQQHGGSWQALVGDETRGSNPVYVE